MSNVSATPKKSRNAANRDDVRKATVQECMPGQFIYLGVQEFTSPDESFEVHAALDHQKQLLTHQHLNSLMIICWTAALGVNKKFEGK